MSCHVFLPDRDESKSGSFLAGEMHAEFHPELLFYVHKEGTLGALQFSATGQEKMRRVKEVWGL